MCVVGFGRPVRKYSTTTCVVRTSNYCVLPELVGVSQFGGYESVYYAWCLGVSVSDTKRNM